MDKLWVSVAPGAWLSIVTPYLRQPVTGTRGGRRSSARVWQRIRLILTTLGLWALVSGPASAVLITVTPTVSFSDGVSVTDDESAGDTSNDGADLGNSLLEQFDAMLGVLTDATINLVSIRDQDITVSATAGTPGGRGGGRGGGAGGNSVTSIGSGSSTANISAPGVNYTFSTAIGVNGECTEKPWKACSSTTLATGVTTDQDIAAASNLDSYVGSGSVTVSRTAATLSASQENAVFDGTETTQYDLTWAGDLSVTYSYLLHAAASFDSGAPDGSLTLDFGTVTQDSSVSPLGFSIFNLAATDRAGLDLDSFSLTGGTDTSALSSNLALFADLAQGGEQVFQASFDTASVGSFLETYTLVSRMRTSAPPAAARPTTSP